MKKGISVLVVLLFTTVGASYAYAAQAVRADPQLLQRFESQADPLAAPVLGRGWQGYAKRYELIHRRIGWLQGKVIGPAGSCEFRAPLTLAPDQDVIESRARAINSETCLALVETGVPRRAGATPSRPGMESQSDSAAAAAVPPPPEPDPAGEVVDPNDVPKEVDPEGVTEPGNIDPVDQQPSGGADADAGGDPDGTIKRTLCAVDPGIPACGGCPPICGDGPRVATVRSAGNFKSWWDDPPGFDVASVQDGVDYRYGGGCAGWGTWNWSYDVRWLAASGWQNDDFNHHYGQVCGYVYHSSYAHFRNNVFCRVLIGPLFGRTTKLRFNRNTVRGLANGTLKGLVHSRKSGGCARLLGFNHRIQRTAG